MAKKQYKRPSLGPKGNDRIFGDQPVPAEEAAETEQESSQSQPKKPTRKKVKKQPTPPPQEIYPRKVHSLQFRTDYGEVLDHLYNLKKAHREVKTKYEFHEQILELVFMAHKELLHNDLVELGLITEE